MESKADLVRGPSHKYWTRPRRESASTEPEGQFVRLLMSLLAELRIALTRASTIGRTTSP